MQRQSTLRAVGAHVSGGIPLYSGSAGALSALPRAARRVSMPVLRGRSGGTERIRSASMDAKRIFRSPIFWIVVAVFGVVLASQLISATGGPKSVDTSTIVTDINSGNVQTAKLIDRDQVINVTLKDGTKLTSNYIDGQGVVLQAELQKQVDAKNLPGGYDISVPKSNAWVSLLESLLPIALIVLLFFFLMNQVQGGGSRVMNFGKSRAKVVSKDTPKTTFADVAGADEAVEELQEIKEFLAEPLKFQAVGAKIPRGVLLYGPPGTGKTLLARAVAGEAGVPFYSISGSDFVEMFVGVGASRVRDLFEQAKTNAPAIVFVDEIDAVGRHRGAGLGGGHDEREQTLNQLLVEMDGFDVTTNVILIAATNRPDILDPALLRPGRFDRQIAVESPDLEGRLAILGAHLDEHGIEVQLPFLQTRRVDFAFVPIVIGTRDFEVLEALGNAIGEFLAAQKERILMIASSDMNHYESDAITRAKDHMAIEQILGLDARGLFDVAMREKISICGLGPTVVMLTAAKHLRATKTELIEYGTSGDVSGDREMVVGYAGIVVR